MTNRSWIPSLPARPPAGRKRLLPVCERLETLSLLSTVSPVVSGYVFADRNNDGVRQATEGPVAGAKLQLRNAAGAVVATATTGANGSYRFSADATVSTAPRSVTQTLTLPAAFTNVDASPLSPALPLFDPSLGTLVGVRVAAAVTVVSTIQGENTSLSDSADISGSVSGSARIEGLNRSLSGDLSATTPVFHAAPSDGTLDFAGPSGATFTLDPTEHLSATVTDTPGLAFYTATPGRSTITPTATIHASVTEDGGTGNTWYQAETRGGVVLSVTYDYTPSNALKPGPYTVVPIAPQGYVQGKASSHDGAVVITAAGRRAISVNLHGSGSADNQFGLLTVPKSPPGVTTRPGTTVTHGPDAPQPSPGLPTAAGFFGRGARAARVAIHAFVRF